MMDGFGMNVTAASEIFTAASRHASSIRGVTPTIIANMIDELV
jgi:hypothetical protein